MATGRPGAERSVEDLRAALTPLADPERAAAMAAYMKHHGEFLGIGAPDRRAAAAPVLAGLKGAPAGELLGVAAAWWAQPEREFRYCAADLLRANVRELSVTDLEHVRRLVVDGAWWDVVDPLAAVVGGIVRRHSDAASLMDEWAVDADIWVARVAVLHQLGWKADADPLRVFRYCGDLAGSGEFFIRKAIGWALRDLARSYPDDVRAFVEEQRDRLSPLSVREATKHL